MSTKKIAKSLKGDDLMTRDMTSGSSFKHIVAITAYFIIINRASEELNNNATQLDG